MTYLQTRYPGVAFPDEWKSILSIEDNRYISELLGENAQNAMLAAGSLRFNIEELNPQDPESIFRYFLFEQYMTDSVRKSPLIKLGKSVYYLLRPLLSIKSRSVFQRRFHKKWQSIPFPKWPVDTTVDLLATAYLGILSGKGISAVYPEYWPDGAVSAAVITHDVETSEGLLNSRRLMDIEEEMGIKSSFEIVPRERYRIDYSLLDEMRERGFEICVHGYNHDGKLFEEAEFRKRRQLIREFAEYVGARGFRSPVMYRDPKMIEELGFDYDMSYPTVGHLDPQRGGCCTVMPFFIGNTLEIPLTTIQDYTLFNILGRKDMEIWREQIEYIYGQNGLISFIIHPDYMLDHDSVELYRKLLRHLKNMKDLWLATPNEVNNWWRERSERNFQDDN